MAKRGRIDKSRVSEDVIMKVFWRQNDRFADLFNAVLFGGEQVIKPEGLKEADTDVSGTIVVDEYKETLKRTRDVVKKYYNGVEFNILGLELQQKVHLAMPLRTMLYDGLGYVKEYNEIKHNNKRHYKMKNSGGRNKKDSGYISTEEFLSGLRKSDKFHPIVTIVFYYSEKPWDGPLSLKDMMIDMPDNMLGIFNDYKINLVQIKGSEKYHFKNEEVQDFFNITRGIYDDEFERIFSEYSDKGITKELVWMIGKITGSDEIMNVADKESEDGNMLCTALQNYQKRAEEKGKSEGRSESKIELISNLMKNMNKTMDEAMELLGIEPAEREELKKKM